MDQKTMINDMTRGPLGKQILLYSFPLMLANLLQTLYNLVDLAVVGQVTDSACVSAVSIAGQITFLLYALGMGLGSGTQILISQQVGAGNMEGVKKTTGTSLTATVVLAAVVTAAGLIFKNLLLTLLNTPAEAMRDAQEYMLWCCLGIPFTYGYGSLCAVLRGMGDSKRPMYIIGIAALTNVVLDILLVYTFGMRAKGAAIATAIAQLVSFLFALVHLYRRRESFGFDFKPESFRVDRHILGMVVNLSAPLAFMSVAITVSMMFINAWVNAYGVVASAVSGIGSKLYSVVNIVTQSMQTADATVTGQNIAARQLDRVKRSMYICTGTCLGYWAVISVLCLAFPRQLFGLFSNDPAVLDMAPSYLVISVVMYLSFATMAPALGFVNGVGNVRFNFIISMLDGVIARIGLGLLLSGPLGLGLHGYWWGSALAGFVSTVGGWAYFFSGRWKTRKILA